MDIIKITDLEVFAYHGIFKEENTLGQKFIISVSIFTDTRNAGQSDNINKSINYVDVCKFIKEYMYENTFNLIETAAEKIAEELLLNFKNIQKIIIELKKPFAAIDFHFKSISVQIERGWKKAFIALGSNIEDKRKHIENAIKKIKASKFCKVLDISDFIVTKPVGKIDQDDFLNGCMKIETLFNPFELLDFLNSIEAIEGRERVLKWGPRTLDLDIIFYDDIILNTNKLTIPHIEMVNREFVLKPLCQIAPFEKHPIFGKTVLQLYDEYLNKNL